MGDLHIAAAAKRAADFERAMREVEAVLSLTPDQIERMGDELRAATEAWQAAPWWKRAWWRICGLVRGLWHWRLLRG